jgi:hypothetical protein
MVGLSSSATSSELSLLSDVAHEAVHTVSLFALEMGEFSLVNAMSNEPIISASVRISNDVHTLGTRRVPDNAELQISAGVLGL